MLGFFKTTHVPEEVTVEEDILSIFGATVQNPETGQVGVLRSVGISPYHTEEQAGVIRAYVVALPNEDQWGDYWLAGDVQFVD